MNLATLERWGEESLAALVTVMAALALYQGVRRSTRLLVKRKQMTHVMALRLRLTARWVLATGTALIVLQQTGIFLQAWALLSAVVAALAVGFVASWSLLSNITCALLVLFYRPFRVGDEIEVLESDGKAVAKGRVIDLNLFFTTVVQGDAAIRIPNNLFVQKYMRVQRAGEAPDPATDATDPFFTITPGAVLRAPRRSGPKT